MKFVALVSGGKDSIYAIVLAIKAGHELVACVHLAAPPHHQDHRDNHINRLPKDVTDVTSTQQSPGTDDEEEEEEEESYMYQTAASEAVYCQVAQCMGVPLICHPRTGTSLYTSLVYPPPPEPHPPQQDSTPVFKDEASHDEVEDLHDALCEAVRQFPQIQAVCCGAILSTYQRVRVEHVVCDRLQLSSLCYLWRRGAQPDLLHEMIHEANVDAVLVKTAAPPGLNPRQHLGQSLAALEPHLLHCHKQYQMHVCGEGGEYESLVLDCPSLFPYATLVLDRIERIIDRHDEDVGTLYIHKCHAQWKKVGIEPPPFGSSSSSEQQPQQQAPSKNNALKEEQHQKDCQHLGLHQQNSDRNSTKPFVSSSSTTATAPIRLVSQTRNTTNHDSVLKQQPPRWMPHIRRVSGGLWSVSELSSTFCVAEPPLLASPTHAAALLRGVTSNGDTSKETTVVGQALRIFEILSHLLQTMDCTAQDIIMVHLYLADMTDFALINTHYKRFFGIVLPPSRSTVAVVETASMERCRIRLDCVVQCGSGAYMRLPESTCSAKPNDSTTLSSNSSNVNPYTTAAHHASSIQLKLREVLHVQSLSHWAPVCVGPYSQANTLRGCVHFLAGQIGLVPATTKLRDTWTGQLQQCWTNVANVLDALDAASVNQNALSTLVFVADSVFQQQENDEHLEVVDKSVSDDSRDNVWHRVQSICKQQIKTNGGVTPGKIDGTMEQSSSNECHWDGYEDEETQREIEGEVCNSIHDANEVRWHNSCPILIVSIAQMPVGALTEVEVVAASRRATKSLSKGVSRRSTTSRSRTVAPTDWNTGHDFLTPTLNNVAIQDNIQIDASFCLLGSVVAGEAPVGSALVTATYRNESYGCKQGGACQTAVFRTMLQQLKAEPGFNASSVLHVRLYHVVELNDDEGVPFAFDESSLTKCSFFSSLGSEFTTETTPAVTVIPVRRISTMMHHSPEDQTKFGSRGAPVDNGPFFALTALSVDPIHLEQSMWIHHPR